MAQLVGLGGVQQPLGPTPDPLVELVVAPDGVVQRELMADDEGRCRTPGANALAQLLVVAVHQGLTGTQAPTLGEGGAVVEADPTVPGRSDDVPSSVPRPPVVSRV